MSPQRWPAFPRPAVSVSVTLAALFAYVAPATRPHRRPFRRCRFRPRMSCSPSRRRRTPNPARQAFWTIPCGFSRRDRGGRGLNAQP